MIRKWASLFTRSVNKRVVARRRPLHVPIKISFEPDKNTGGLVLPPPDLSTRGETHDLSSSGVAFIVSSIRIQQYYLVGEDRTLRAEMTLPSGKVKMKLMGVRYEQVGEHVSTTQYLVGATILDMTETDREAYREFLTTRPRKGGAFELGVNKS
ncbi:MAG TPA: hypothetical protein VMM38_14955 [Aridibacter sp.]|nr:hypothetical protein [Aridibacter sp.]